MKKLSTFLALLLCSFSLIFIFEKGNFLVLAESEDQKLQDLNKQIEEYQKQIANLKNQASTLSNEIAKFNAQISLTELKINQTQEQILLLGGRIDELESSLESLSDAFASRAVETYKIFRLGDSIYSLLATSDLTQAVSKFHYLRKVQEADRNLLQKLQSAQNSYKVQRSSLEELDKQLTQQKLELSQQKAGKANLLAVTKNDEKKYQQLLAAAKAEIEAIQAIIAGKGSETQAGHVSEGQRIASIIQGPSCNSSGEHLHFIVSENGVTKNPFTYLKSGVDYENCSGSSCGSSDGDAFNPSGNWNWPINPKIKFSQGYGSTWATKNTWVGKIYNFHNGIDINGSGEEVRSVRAGTLYQGSYSGSGGCRLRYVRVDHDDTNLDTFYLHINY